MKSLVVRAAFAGFPVMILGCYPPSSRLNAPPQGETPRPSQLQDPFVYMVDNSMLADMSLTDIHFVPHTAELNSLGARRLDRYAQLLEIYGGTLRYDTDLADQDMVESRMKHIKDFLETTGIDATRIEVARNMAGGKGLLASEAIQVRAGTLSPPAALSAGPGGSSAGRGSSGRSR